MIRSAQYRLMIYFVVATILFYEKDVIIIEGETAGKFADRNKAVIDRVNEEAMNIFKYELSDDQIGKGILAYLGAKVKPQSVIDTKAYELNHINDN